MVTLQWAHYQYFDAIQFLKQGVLANGSAVTDYKYGTYNIPEEFGYCASLNTNNAKYGFNNILKELLVTVSDENVNSNYIQNVTVSDMNIEGFNYLTFEF